MQYPGVGPVRVSAEALPLIRVVGEARVEVAPDMAEVSLGFTVRAPQAAAAYQQTAEALSRVVAVLLATGIPRHQLQTEQVNLFPVYENERLVGYEGTGTLRVMVRELTAVGEVIDRAIGAGANNVRGVRFEVRDTGPHEATALTAAVQDAQRKAGLLAQSLGVRVGPVWRVEAEPAPGPVIPVMARAAAELPVLPGTLTLTRVVRVEYLIQYG